MLGPRDKSPGSIAMDPINRIDTNTPSMIEIQTRTDSSTKPLSDDSTSSPTETANLPLGQVIRLYPKVAATCLCLATIVVGWGYDLVVIGAINGVEPFQDDYGEVFRGKKIIPSTWLSLWLASTPLGMAFGSVFAGWFQDVVGRRRSLMTGAVICGVGVALIFFSYLPKGLEAMRAMFFVGKVVQGFAVGHLKVTAMTYISETTPTALRGPAMGLIPTANLVGQLLGSVVSYVINDVPGKGGYLGAFGSLWILTVVPLVLSLVLPESPSYLVQQGEEDKALEAATKLYAPRVDPTLELAKVRDSITEERELTGEATYLACFNSTHRRRTWIVLMANLIPALFGLDLISKANYFIQIIGMDSGTSLLILMGGIVAGTIANGVGIWVLSRVGRRKVIIVSLGAATVLWVGIGVAGFWKGVAVANFVAAAMIAIIVVCGMGCWPASYAVMGETSSLRMRAKTQGVGGVVQQGSSVLLNFTLPYIFNPDAGNLGAKTGFVYVGTGLIGIGMTFFGIPEMRGRSPLDIDRMFQNGVKTREFKNWRGEDEEK